MSTPLEQAIGIAKSGQREQARDQLMDILRQNRHNEEAWFWLSTVVDKKEEEFKCLRNVLRLNPHHADAQQKLKDMGRYPLPLITFSKVVSSQRKNKPVHSKNLWLWFGSGIATLLLGGIICLGMALWWSNSTVDSSTNPTIAVISTPTISAPTTISSSTILPTNVTATQPSKMTSSTHIPTATPISAESIPTPRFTPTPIFVNTGPQLNQPDEDTATSKILYLAWTNRHSGGRYDPYQIRLMNIDGSEQVLLGEVNPGSLLLDWSADGHMVLLSNKKEGTFALLTDDSGRTLPLTSNYSQAGTWSPDSQQVALLYDRQAYLLDLRTGKDKVITLPLDISQSSGVTGLSWSPDGTWLALEAVGSQNGQALHAVYRYNITNGQATLLYQQLYNANEAILQWQKQPPQTYPVVSPIDNRVLIEPLNMSIRIGEEDNSQALLEARRGLVAIDPDQQLVDQVLRSGVPVVESPRWSPDGQWVATPYVGDIYLIKADGTAAYNLTQSDTRIERHVTWSPQGRYLVYSVETPLRALELERFDLNTGEIRRLTDNTGQWGETFDAFPIWSLLLSSDVLAQLENNPPVTLPPTPTPHSNAIVIPTADPSLLENLNLEPPPATFNPPWWDTRYFYRRPLQLTTSAPIPSDPDALLYPPLAQVTFDTSLIHEHLFYPERGYDIRIAWWGGEDRGWVDLPRYLHGLDGEKTTITFPLWEGLEDNSNAYYLYYGSRDQLQVWDKPLSLFESQYSNLGPYSDIIVGSLYMLVPSESGQNEYLLEQLGKEADQITWVPGPEGRMVAQLDADTSFIMSSQMFPAQGVLSLFIKPATLSADGVILSGIDRANDNIEYPIISYENGVLNVTIGGVNLVTPLIWETDRWYHLALSWQEGNNLTVYQDGLPVAEAPYQPDLKAPIFYVTQLGAMTDWPALSGQYFNFYTLYDYLIAPEILSFYRAQANLTVTLAQTPTIPVVTTTVTPTEGASIRAPDGQSWVTIPPNAVTEPITISLGHVTGQYNEYQLSRFDLFPVAWDHSKSLEENLGPLLTNRNWLTQSLVAPIHIYYKYDPDFVDWPQGIIVSHWDEQKSDWVSQLAIADTHSHTAVSREANQWNTYFIGRNLGLPGGNRFPWPDD